MKKFKFRLEKVLHYRVAIQEEKKGVLTEKMGLLREAEIRLAEYLQLQSNNSVSEYNNLADYQLQTAFASRLSAKIVEERERIIECERLVEEAREAYVEATKDVKSLETLKKKKFEEHKEFVQKLDEKFLDELTIQRGNQISRGD